EAYNSPKAGYDADACPTLRTGVRCLYLTAPLDAHARSKVHTGLMSVYVTEPPPQWQHLRWAVSPAILAGGYAPLRKQWLSLLAGYLAHKRGATCRASACLPPHSPPYWGSRSARRRISGVRPIPMGVATTRGED